jgi:hypothetical protein
MELQVMADGSFEVLSVDSARAHLLSPQPCSSTSLSILSSDLDKTAQLTSSFIEESDACFPKIVATRHGNIQGGPDITCQKNSGPSEGSNKSRKPKIMGIN